MYHNNTTDHTGPHGTHSFPLFGVLGLPLFIAHRIYFSSDIRPIERGKKTLLPMKMFVNRSTIPPRISQRSDSLVNSLLHASLLRSLTEIHTSPDWSFCSPSNFESRSLRCNCRTCCFENRKLSLVFVYRIRSHNSRVWAVIFAGRGNTDRGMGILDPSSGYWDWLALPRYESEYPSQWSAKGYRDKLQDYSHSSVR